MLHFFKVKNTAIILASLFVLLAAAPSQAGGIKIHILDAIEKCRAASWFRINSVGVASTGEIKVAQALKLCQKAKKLAPDNAKVWAYLSRIHAAAKHYDKSFEYAQKSAKAGSAEGMTYMGVLYDLGWGVKKDEKKAAKWYHKAAEGGSVPAMKNLGNVYEYGVGFHKNLNKASKWYRKAAEQGDSQAQCNWGYMLAGGHGVKKNLATAVKWYRKAAEQGLARCQHNLGVALRYGEGVKKSYKKAAEWYLKAAKQGYVHAQFSLGIAFELGEGVKKDFVKAVKWYLKAAKQGEKWGQCNLGHLYEVGGQEVENFTKAAKWYKKAADQGAAGCQYNIGLLLKKGKGVRKNTLEAIKWFEKAAKQGHADAQNEIGMAFEYGKEVIKSYKNANKWYKKSAAQGNKYAQYNFADMLENGKGVKRNYSTALEWYKKSAKRQNVQAYLKIGDFYYNGYGVVKNLNKAIYWYSMSDKEGDGVGSLKLGDALRDRNNFGDLEKALHSYIRARPKFIEKLGGDDPVIAVLNDYIAGIYKELKRYDEAINEYKYALLMYEKNNKLRQVEIADALLEIGNIYKTIRRYNLAKDYYNRVIAMHKKLKSKGAEETVALALVSIGDANKKLSLYNDVISYYSKAIKIYTKKYLENSLVIAELYNDIGINYRILSSYSDALSSYSRSLAIYKKKNGDDHETVAGVLLNMGVVYNNISRKKEALKFYKHALVIYKKKNGDDHETVADTLLNMGDVYHTTYRKKEALKLYKKALIIYSKNYSKYHSRISMILNNMGITYSSLNNYVDSLKVYNRALEIEKTYKTVNGSDGIAATITNIGGVYRDMSRYNDAMIYALYGLVLRMTKVQKNINGLGFSYSNIFFTLYKKNDKESAIIFAKMAVNIQQKIRSLNVGLNKEFSSSLLESKRVNYEFLSNLLIEQGRLAEAEQVMAMLKQREFFTFMKRGQADERAGQIAFTALEQVAVNQFNEALQVPVSIGRELQKLEDKKRKGQKLDTAQLARMKTLTAQQDKALKALQQKMQVIMENLLKNPDNLQNSVEQETALMGKLKKLGKNVALYQSVVMEDKVHLLVFTGSGAVARKTVIDKAVLSKKIAEFRSAISSQGAVKQKAKALYDLLIKPVEADLKASGAKTVLLSLDGVLRYLPYAALYDGKHYLIEKFSLVLDTPMARPFWQDKAADWTLADGFGMSKGAGNFSALPNVENELAGIVVGADGKGILPGKSYLNEAFTQDSLKNGLRSSAPVLHIATHFQFKAGYPAGSHLLLGDGSHLNLATMAREPATYDFSGKDLVALSACQTALGTSRGAMGAEIDGLGALIVSQGGKSVLATLWSVADKSTSLLMQRFYELRAKEKMGKGQALATAQREFLKDAFGTLGKGKSIVLALARGGQKLGQPTKIKIGTQLAKDYPGFSHPYYWAPFVLMGNWK